MAGPLAGVRIIELAGIGPGPYCGMLLADLGAEVIRVDRYQPGPLEGRTPPEYQIHNRNRQTIRIDIRKPEGAELVRKLCKDAHGLIEGLRPGVTERLGVGPEDCMKANPKLVYGRMTGWGQEGPLAKVAGHDQNYIALTGVLHAMGRKGEAPVPPLNLVGDFGGGGLWLAFGMVAAIYEAEKSGKGQVIDAAMIDGASSLFSSFYGMLQAGAWIDDRGVNMLDTGAHFYEVYETKDGKYVSIGSIEPQFYAMLLEATGLDKEADSFPAQFDQKGWPEMKEKLTEVFKTKTRDEWVGIMEGTDICFAPVLSIAEAPEHAHHKARGTFVEVEGVTQPMPGPRFSRTSLETPKPAVAPGTHTDDVLKAAGYDAAGIEELRKSEIVA